MHRRAFLSAAGLASFAGCLSGSEPIDTPERTEEPNTPAPTPESTPTPDRGEPEVVITDEQVKLSEGRFITTTYATGAVTNEGDAASGKINLSANWLDESGNLLGTDRETLVSLGAGETWAPRIQYIGNQPEVIASVNLSGEYGNEPPVAPDDVVLRDTRLQFGEDEIRVTGKVDNKTGEEVDYIEAHAKFYNGSGDVLSSWPVNQAPIPAGQTWAFEINATMEARADQIKNYEVLLGTTF